MPTDGGVLNKYTPDFSIYVTHGTLVPIKGLARRFSGKKVHILATYTENKYTLFNKPELAASVHREDIPSCFTIVEFIALIDEIKTQYFIDIPDVMLCIDGNLGCLAGQTISETFLQLVESIAPTFLFAFSETPSCVDSAQQYLAGEEVILATEGIIKKYRLPSDVKIGRVSDKAGISGVIEQMLNKGMDLKSIRVDEMVVVSLDEAIMDSSVADKVLNDKNKKKSCIDCIMSFFTSERRRKITPTHDIEGTDNCKNDNQKDKTEPVNRSGCFRT